MTDFPSTAQPAGAGPGDDVPQDDDGLAPCPGALETVNRTSAQLPNGRQPWPQRAPQTTAPRAASARHAAPARSRWCRHQQNTVTASEAAAVTK
ncbi:hypothetical protein Shyhy01_19040 [Streptomyces hygroscopicus subsp. hygroscopicus]|nr:hypothetical protein Shyhy01_19040 [Streptomyces hygroscopicus subsp. hygroscopicus]